MKVLDLKKEKTLIAQYVELRNSYAGLLLSSTVNAGETEEWLQKEDIEIRVLVEDGGLLGAAVLYLNKSGEIAFFVREQNKGLGSKLLEIIEEVARARKLGYVWAWVLEDNLIAQRVFEKNGFSKEKIEDRLYRGEKKTGFRYRKVLGL